jgi:DNA-binding transcriptional ArsR family regulator
MTVTGPKVKDFTSPSGRIPVEVIANPTFELLNSLFVWTAHEDPEYAASYAVGETWFEGVGAAASPRLRELLEQFVGVEDLWVALVGYALCISPEVTPEGLVDHLRSADPVELRRDLIVMGCAHCKADAPDDLAMRAARGEAAAIDAVTSMEACKMSEGTRRFLEMAPADTATLIADTVETFDREVFHGGGSVSEVLERDAAAKRQLGRTMEPAQLVEVATNGVTFTMLPEVVGIVLIPSIVTRPWVTITEAERRRVFCYPVAEENLLADPDAPPSYLVAAYRALGDERRLRLLRILSEGPISLAEVTERVGIAKSTVHHHLSILRQAGLVRITLGADKEYSLRRDVVSEVGRMLAGFLTEK